MNELGRKLFRDLKSRIWLFGAVAVVILLAVAMFIAPSLAYKDLKSSYDYTYLKLHFADLWLKVTQAPQGTVDLLSVIPGVEKAIERVNMDAPLKLPSGASLVARVISLPAQGRAQVNDVQLTGGSYFSKASASEILVAKNFADYHNLKPGDTLSLQLGGRAIEFRIAGIVISPEYIYAAKSRQEMFVSADEFGVVFVRQDVLAQATGSNSVNEFCLIAAPGAQVNNIQEQAAAVLAPYNVVDVSNRIDQPSNSGLQLDLQGFGKLAEIFPLIFLVVGILTTYILLTRLVQRQRNQIGLMRALGYSRASVVSHYLGFAVLIGAAGSLLGVVAGYFMGLEITSLYVQTLHLPFTSSASNWPILLEGFFIGFIPSIAAGIIPAYTAGSTSPAEAMRAASPTAGHRLLLERVFPFLERLSMLWKIPLRNIFRNRRRSLSIVIGIALGVALVLTAFGFIDSIDGLLGFQFSKIQLYDAKISFAAVQPESVSSEVAGWPQVTAAEPFVQVPIRIDYQGKTASTLLYGLPADNRLLGLYREDGSRVSISGDGIFLGSDLKDQLGLAGGENLTLETPAGELKAKVAGFLRQPLGSTAFVSLNQAQLGLGGHASINGVFLKTRSSAAEIRNLASKALGPVSIEITREFKATITQLMSLFSLIAYVVMIFGILMAAMVVFAVISVSLAERSREIATMRTLGEKGAKISTMVSLENLFLTALGLAFGLPAGYGIALSLLNLISSNLFSIHLFIYSRSYLITAILIVIIVLLSQLPGIRTINRLDLARVTKELVS